MHFSTMVSCVVSLFAVVLSSETNAYIISCTTNSIQDQANPGMRQLCATLEQIVDDLPQQAAYSGVLGEPNTLASGKRVDHSFLRIGKRFNL